MEVEAAIRQRRTVKRYGGGRVPREVLEDLLELVVRAPNHRMTEPWEFRVLGPDARRRFGEILGDIRAGKLEDPAAAEAVRSKSVADARALPASVAFLQRLDPDPSIREEDYAALYMGIQNLLLAAVARGYHTQVKTGAVLQDPRFRTLVGAEEDERVVALVHLGASDDPPAAKPRSPAAERTRWLP